MADLDALNAALKRANAAPFPSLSKETQDVVAFRRPAKTLADNMTMLDSSGRQIVVLKPRLGSVTASGLPPGFWPSWKRGIWA